jgi:hypothetical protein
VHVHLDVVHVVLGQTGARAKQLHDAFGAKRRVPVTRHHGGPAAIDLRVRRDDRA